MSAHWYNPAGDLVDPWTPGAYPSVSTILDRVRSDAYGALVGRMGQAAADELMATAAARGTRVHAACEALVNHKPVFIEDGDEPYLQGFKNWWEMMHTSGYIVQGPPATELFVFSDKYKYAGRLDIAIQIDRQMWIIDIKTGVDSVRHGLQLKLYQQAYYEMTGIRARMGVLALDAKRKAGYRNSRAPYGLKEYKEPWAPCEAHIKVFKWWNKKQPARAPKEVEVWVPEFAEYTGWQPND